MRTTLKGIRVRLSASGSGSVSNGVASPSTSGQPRVGPLSKLSQHDAHRRRPVKTVAKVLLWLVMAALVAAGGLAGGVWLFLEDSVDAVRPKSEDVIVAKEELVEVAADDPTAPAIALVIGYDARQGPDGFDEARSDTVMLLRADPARDTMTLLSFPRDLLVFHPGCKKRREWTGKLNEAYVECGAVGVLRTVQRLAGIKVNFLITVNFTAFKQMVAKAGGVYVDVDQRYFNSQTGPGGYAAIDLHPGYQKLSGQQALDFARYRHTDSDIFRTFRQQIFLKSFKQQVSSNISLTSFPGFVGALRDNVEVQKGGKDIDGDTVLRYARFLYGLSDGGFHQVKIDQDLISENRATGNLSVSEETLAGIMAEFENPDTEASAKAADVATGARPNAPKPANTTIEVFNGNNEVGSAADAAEQLRQRNYVAESIGDADNYNYFDTVVQFNPNIRRSKAAAEKVADLFDGVVEAPPNGVVLDTTLRVIVGKTYHNAIAPGAADRTPDRAAASIIRAPEEIAPLLTEASGRSGFVAYVPQQKAFGAALARQEPVRAYKLGDHRAVSIQYVVNQFKHWGFMQTTWLDAPILDDPSTEREYKGRTYQLFFSGPRLQMVAFEENDMVFWVRNTLDQHLTNETMLELAHGFRAPADTAP
jgi:LCP family protein required for cell wall assembly